MLAFEARERLHSREEHGIVAAVRFLWLGCSILLCSCATIEPQRQLVGEWRYADAKQSCHYIFAADGTFRGDVLYRGRTISRFHGRWSVAKSTISYRYAGDELGRIPAGTIDSDMLLRVDRDAYLIRAADGSERKYVRVR